MVEVEDCEGTEEVDAVGLDEGRTGWEVIEGMVDALFV